MNNRGVSILEIVIYIALFTIITIIIGSQINSLSRNFTGGSRVSSLQTDCRDAMSILTKEIRNTGCKTYLVPVNGAMEMYTNQKCFNSDSSSFVHTEGDTGDKLVIIKAVLNQAGLFQRVDTVEYSLQNGILYRKVQNVSTELAQNIGALQFQYGILGAGNIILSENPMNNLNWASTNCTKTTQTPGILVSTTGIADVKMQYNTGFNITSPCRLSVRFDVRNVGSSVIADTMKWVIRSSAGSILATENFKAGTSIKMLEIPVPAFANGLLSMEFRSKGTGSIYMENIALTKIENGTYTWSNNPSSAEKKYVRAIRVLLMARSKKTKATQDDWIDTVGNVPVNRSGQFSWRLYTETIKVPNNGLF